MLMRGDLLARRISSSLLPFSQSLSPLAFAQPLPFTQPSPLAQSRRGVRSAFKLRERQVQRREAADADAAFSGADVISGADAAAVDAGDLHRKSRLIFDRGGAKKEALPTLDQRKHELDRPLRDHLRSLK